jgi:serine/threonine protein kinase
MLGERLGKWVIFQELGRGGMGRVYLAQEEIGGRKAALKVLASELAQEIGFLQRFQREIETLSKLDHPGIVKFYEAGFENGLYFFAMEYVEGQSLEKVLQEQGRLPWHEVLDIATQICGALRHVHDSGVIHRDLKPPNILRTVNGEIKLTDFGIARVFAAKHLTSTGGVVGTAEFLSPEQASGKPVTKRSDLYSLGVVLYTLLTGRTPFEGSSFVDLLHKHRYALFDRPGRIVPDLPYEVEELVCQLLEKEPEKRPPDCLVLAKQIDSIRRRLERKSQLTSLGQNEVTVAENRVDRLRAESLPGPATLMSKLMRSEVERQKSGGFLGWFFNQAWALSLLLALCVGTIVWAFWPPSAEHLFHEGSELMEKSDHVSQWERAWKEYFEPLNSRFPDHPYQEKVEEYQRKIAVARNSFPSEAQRFYQKGERLRKEGDLAGARRVWLNVMQAFQHSDSEKNWVSRAEQALAELDKEGAHKERWQTVRPALARAVRLRDSNRLVEAEKIWSALEQLYQNDPFAQEILEEVARARGK